MEDDGSWKCIAYLLNQKSLKILQCNFKHLKLSPYFVRMTAQWFHTIAHNSVGSYIVDIA